MLSKPLLSKLSKSNQKRKTEIASVMIEKEVEKLLSNGAITSVNQEGDQFLSILFPKKDGNQGTVISLKQLNQFMLYQHFKMEDLHSLNEVLLEGNNVCKLDLKDAYFYVPLNKKFRKYLRFLWSSNLYLGPMTSIWGIHKIVENSCGFVSPYELSRLIIYPLMVLKL